MNLKLSFPPRSLISRFIVVWLERYAGRFLGLLALLVLAVVSLIGLFYLALPGEAPLPPIQRPAVEESLRRQVFESIEGRARKLNELWQQEIADPF